MATTRLCDLHLLTIPRGWLDFAPRPLYFCDLFMQTTKSTHECSHTPWAATLELHLSLVTVSLDVLFWDRGLRPPQCASIMGSDGAQLAGAHEWAYRGEGNCNLVVGLQGARQILRIRKTEKPQSLLGWILVLLTDLIEWCSGKACGDEARDLAFYCQVMRPLIGAHYTSEARMRGRPLRRAPLTTPRLRQSSMSLSRSVRFRWMMRCRRLRRAKSYMKCASCLTESSSPM
ncbi:hypothetical protein HUJ04_000142 [Dendroctonus ponderosae]|nr:hypothetical protein HUJ04_000142 [Dendroctonus ponderosae]